MLIIALICFLILLTPAASAGAKAGLLLWSNQILPILWPFTIFIQWVIHSNLITKINYIFDPLTQKIPFFSKNSSFCFITGFLCGFPSGAMSTCELYHSNQISKKEAQLLTAVCNNPSPVFMHNYVHLTLLNGHSLSPKDIFIFYAIPLLWYIIRKSIIKKEKSIDHSYQPISADKKDFSVILLSSAEIMLSIGVCMMLFSILTTVISLITCIPFPVLFTISSLLELTNGTTMIASLSSITMQTKTALIMGLSAFGGCCIHAQTYHLIHQQELSFVQYIIDRISIALITYVVFL